MIFIFSTFTGLPDRFFHGYAFEGADFVSGQDGARQHYRDTGRKLTGGLDGCYVAISKEGDLHRVGVDHSGLKKLFLYQEDNVWVLSNSISAIARHLADNGVRLKPNWVQMQSLKIESTITSQNACFDTLLAGVKMIPSWCELEILRDKIRIIERPKVKEADYEETLHNYIETWVRRFETLLIDERVSLSCDLTGGKDSRMVFAIIEKARQRLGECALANFAIRSSTGDRWSDDLIAAKRIAHHFNRKINLKSSPSLSHRQLSGKDIFNRWSDLNICQYYPIYFPSSDVDAFKIQVHGGGGERHRPFYSFPSFDNFSNKIAGGSSEINSTHSWIAEVGKVLEALQKRFPTIDPWILHYREFRNRFHSGRAPQYRTVLAPLDGPGAESLSNFANKSETSQIHFDVMESLFPGLKDFPYDDPKKGPSSNALAALTVVAVNDQAAPGRAYITTDSFGNNNSAPPGRPLDFLLDRFESVRTEDLLDFMPAIYSKAVESAIKVKRAGKFAHASDGKNITRVLSADLVLSLDQ